MASEDGSNVSYFVCLTYNVINVSKLSYNLYRTLFVEALSQTVITKSATHGANSVGRCIFFVLSGYTLDSKVRGSNFRILSLLFQGRTASNNLNFTC